MLNDKGAYIYIQAETTLGKINTAFIAQCAAERLLMISQIELDNFWPVPMQVNRTSMQR